MMDFPAASHPSLRYDAISFHAMSFLFS
uniref:Uncharacterized protein n=1 Tax=Arundo donax TaxID=35708 RepID=A0A0A9FQP5_ARUDO